MKIEILPYKILFLFLILIIFNFNAKAQIYCTPIGTCGTEYIFTNVKFSSINNTSSCINSGYGNYSATVPPAIITAGTTIPISLTIRSTGINYAAIWIDYNQNGLFETNEYKNLGSVNNGDITTTTTVLNNSVFIPSDILAVGNTRMRVKLKLSNPIIATEACAVTNETEDYTLNIIPAKVAITFTPSFSDTFYTQKISFSAQIKQSDLGLNTTDSLKPRLWAKTYGSNGWKSVKGSLVSGTITNGFWQFEINHDSLNIRRNSCDSVQFYFVAQDMNNPINLGYLPEAGTSHINVQTQISPSSIPFGYRLKPRLRDTIYVSNNNCRYKSLSGENGLFQHINSSLLENDLTIIIDGDALEDGKYSIKNSGLNGHSLTIRPDGNIIRTLSGSYSTTSILQLNGVKNVTVDGSFNGFGKYLRFLNESSVYNNNIDIASNIKIFNSCDSITLINLIFEYKPRSFNIEETSVLISIGTNKGILIKNNLFKEASAIDLPERQLVSVNGNNTAIVKNNEFKNFRESGINIYNQSNNWLIDSNHFYRTIIPPYIFQSFPNFAAISVTGGGHIISNNFIGGQAQFCAGSAMGFMDYPSISAIKSEAPSGILPNIISANKIDNINTKNSSLLGLSSGNFFAILGKDSYCTIKDNSIGNTQSNNATISSSAAYISGINIVGSQNVEILNNTIAALTNNVINGEVLMYGISKRNFVNGLGAFNASTKISNNKIYNLSNSRNGTAANSNVFSDLGGTAGISVGEGLTNLIEQNEIHDISVTSNHVSGIMIQGLSGVIPSIIQRNKIYNLINTSNSIGSCCNDDIYNGIINGIGVDAESTGLDILNNQISITNNNIINPVSIRGIYEAYGNSSTTNPLQRIIYNTVYIGGAANQNGGSAGYFSLYMRVKNINNNIFYNERTGGTKGHYAYRFPNNFPNNASSLLTYTKVNNNLYIVPDTLSFSQIDPNNYRSWSSWKSLTKADSSSYIPLVQNIPSPQFFTNKVTGNLNLDTTNSTCWYANSKALPFTAIAADYDNSFIRSTSIATGYTDIGSDEFSTNTLAPGSFCAGSNTTLTSNIIGNTYQWQQKTVNGFIDLVDNANYNGTKNVVLQINSVPYLWNGQEYRCVINSTIFSDVFSIIVNPTTTPAVNIISSSTLICAGTSISFTATTINGGILPTYQWKKNGNNVGTNSNIYSSNTIANGDIISVVLTSNATCASVATANSNSISITVTPLTTAINISGTTNVIQGLSTIILSTIINGGTSSAYQWQDSTSAHPWQNISGASTVSLNYTPTNGNKLRCILISNAACATGISIISNVLAFTVDTPIPPTGGNGNFRYFPNPVINMLNIDSLKISDEWESIAITSINGSQNIITQNISRQSKVVINVQSLSLGMYLAILRNKRGEMAYFKFIKM
jgi:hypothetical protein